MRCYVSLFLTLAACGTIAGCGHRSYSRAEVAGIIKEIDARQVPADCVVLVALPPIGGVLPDTSDGTILCAINQREFYLKYGTILPSWEPRRTSVAETDQNVQRIVRLREDLDAVRAVLDRVFAAAREEGAGEITADRRAISKLLPPEEWRKLTSSVVALSTRIDAFVQTVQASCQHSNGSTEHSARSGRLWAGILPAADQLAGAIENLGRTGALPAAGQLPEFAKSWRDSMAGLKRQAAIIRASIDRREAPALVPQIRLLQRMLDDFEISPVAGAAFGVEVPNVEPFSGQQRDQSRECLARVRLQLVQIASMWAEAQAVILDAPNTKPILVYEPATRLE